MSEKTELPRPYKTLFEQMAVPRFVVYQDAEGGFRVKYANELALRYFSRSIESVEDVNIQDCLDHDNAIHFEQSFEVCVSKKSPVTIQTLPGVPGRIRIYGFYITPIFDANGNVELLDIIGQMDVADQSILQRERDDAISLLTSIFDVSEVGIVVTDHNHHIVRVNENFVRTYGWSREELINKDLIGIITPDERDASIKYYDRMIERGGNDSGEVKIIRNDGSVANVLYTAATMELSQSRRFQITTVMDITLRKQMEQSLRVAKDQADSSNRSKSVFLANMSHELRTPLNAIIGFSEMMIAETFGALGHDKYKEYLSDVHSSANHLLEIINEVLDMSKIEAGRIELDEGEIDLIDLVDSVLRMMDSRAFGQNVKLVSNFEENLPYLYADQRLVRQILINLAGNAVKFSRDATEVCVKIFVDEFGGLCIIVSDQGVGIPEGKIDEVLEPFGQVADSAERAVHQGTGLGLPLAKAMVELHGGDFKVESELDRGTDIIISFPPQRTIKKS